MEGYAGKQLVGIDLHRRRTVIVRTTESGDVLETVRIVNDVERLASVMARARPMVVLSDSQCMFRHSLMPVWRALAAARG